MCFSAGTLKHPAWLHKPNKVKMTVCSAIVFPLLKLNLERPLPGLECPHLLLEFNLDQMGRLSVSLNRNQTWAAMIGIILDEILVCFRYKTVQSYRGKDYTSTPSTLALVNSFS